MPDGFIVTFIKAFVLANLVMLVFAFLTWLERRLEGPRAFAQEAEDARAHE